MKYARFERQRDSQEPDARVCRRGQARNRYTFAAALARFQKMPVVEQIFTYTANQEKEHAEIFYKFLEPLVRKPYS